MHSKDHLTMSDIVRIKLEIERDLRQLIENLKAEVNRDAISHEELRVLIETLNNGGVSYEVIRNAVNEYLSSNAIATGATPEQVAQINENVERINAIVEHFNTLVNEFNDHVNNTSEIHDRVSTLESEEKVKPSDLSNVATTGNYEDLSNTPTALKNPYPITINGTKYDGSKSVNVNITGDSSSSSGSSVAVDETLSISGAAADAAKVGANLNELKEADEAQDEAIAKKLNASELPTAINTALAQAKASGEFDGKDGEPGAPGYTPQKGVDYFDGAPGAKGDPGYTPQKGVDYFDGAPGKDGKTPVRGTDYWTATDIAEIKSYVDDAILKGAW